MQTSALDVYAYHNGQPAPIDCSSALYLVIDDIRETESDSSIADISREGEKKKSIEER